MLYIGGVFQLGPACTDGLAYGFLLMGGWLGDLALKSGCRFSAVAEHRLIPLC